MNAYEAFRRHDDIVIWALPPFLIWLYIIDLHSITLCWLEIKSLLFDVVFILYFSDYSNNFCYFWGVRLPVPQEHDTAFFPDKFILCNLYAFRWLFLI